MSLVSSLIAWLAVLIRLLILITVGGTILWLLRGLPTYIWGLVTIQSRWLFAATAAIVVVFTVFSFIWKRHPAVRGWWCVAIRVVVGVATGLGSFYIFSVVDVPQGGVINTYLRVLVVLNRVGVWMMWRGFHKWIGNKGFTFMYGCAITGIGAFIAFFFGICPHVAHPFIVGLIIMVEGILSIIRDGWNRGNYEDILKNWDIRVEEFNKNRAPDRGVIPETEEVKEAKGYLIMFKGVYFLILFGVGFYLFIAFRLIWGYPCPRLGDYMWFLFVCFQQVMSAWERFVAWLKKQ